MSAAGFPDDTVEAIRDSIDCNLYFFGEKVEMPVMYLILVLSIAALIGLYVLINILSAMAKTRRGKRKNFSLTE